MAHPSARFLAALNLTKDLVTDDGARALAASEALRRCEVLV